MPCVSLESLVPHDFAPGREVALPGRGKTFVRELSGPSGARTLILLHGWTATAGINWYDSMPELARHFRVVAMDIRGHGRGLQSSRPFTLEACADDAVALMKVLKIESAMVAGYSMGGPIAQLMARRHPGKVDGLVLCATAARFPDTVPVALPLDLAGKGLGLIQKLTGRQMLPLAAKGLYRRIPFADELGRSDLHVLAQGGPALARFNAVHWAGELRVPAACVLTSRDHLVPLRRQRELASLAGAQVFPVKGGHLAAGTKAKEFTSTLVRAALDVNRQIDDEGRRRSERRGVA